MSAFGPPRRGLDFATIGGAARTATSPHVGRPRQLGPRRRASGRAERQPPPSTSTEAER